jgi:hypothetical protein
MVSRGGNQTSNLSTWCEARRRNQRVATDANNEGGQAETNEQPFRPATRSSWGVIFNPFNPVISNPDNLGRVKYLRLLSHQRHIANYLGCLYGEETVVGYTVFHCGDRELIPHLIYFTISSYLQESDKTPGFLIDSGNTYSRRI